MRSVRNLAFFLFLAATVWLTSEPAHAQRSLAQGTGPMELQTANKPYSYARVRFADGTQGERFTLKAGDCPRSTGDCRADRERVEFFDTSQAVRPGDMRWYAWSFYLPSQGFPVPRFDGMPYMFGQIHQRGTSGPEIMLQMFPDGLWLFLSNPYRLDDDPMNPIGPYREVRLGSPRAFFDRWTRIKLQVGWSRGNDGFVRAWVNGRPAWSYDGPTTNANDALYFKYGLYRSFVSRCGGPCPDATVYYRNVRQGRSEAEVN